jgi:hypothetical protein
MHRNPFYASGAAAFRSRTDNFHLVPKLLLGDASRRSSASPHRRVVSLPEREYASQFFLNGSLPSATSSDPNTYSKNRLHRVIHFIHAMNAPSARHPRSHNQIAKDQ